MIAKTKTHDDETAAAFVRDLRILNTAAFKALRSAEKDKQINPKTLNELKIITWQIDSMVEDIS